MNKFYPHPSHFNVGIAQWLIVSILINSPVELGHRLYVILIALIVVYGYLQQTVGVDMKSRSDVLTGICRKISIELRPK